MISKIDFGNNQTIDKNKQKDKYPASMYYYTRPMRADEVNISDRNNQNQYQYAPRTNSRQSVPRRKKINLNPAAVLGIAASAIMCLYFGKAMYAEHKASKVAKDLEKSLNESLAKTSGSADSVLAKGGSLVDAIKACKDPALKRAATNEYTKGPGMMSIKRINEILSLDTLKGAKPEEVDLKRAIKIMDEKIVGMDEVKDDVLTFLVEQNYNTRNGIVNKKPLVLCLDGPAGTGKTTISEVLAEALGMHYKKISLAGASGKAAIKGYEAVYTGASSGGIAQGQLEGATKRVLYCLDEVEKSASSDYNGKVEDTLLSLFDDQAKFTDDNLDVPIDISKSIFVLTTNNFEKLSTPLKNRVRKIEIKPYGVDIKTKIATMKMANSLKDAKLEKLVNVNPDSYKVIAEMTNDEGGRETTRNVDNIVKKLIAKIELGENNGKTIDVTPAFVKKELGPLSETTPIKDRILNSKVIKEQVEKVAQNVNPDAKLN